MESKDLQVVAAEYKKPQRNSFFDVSKIPDEVWEKIFNSYNVEPGQFILNCNDLMALSMISGRLLGEFNRKKRYYLFERVFSCIREYTGKMEHLQCRLVCRRWKCSVDTYFENRPSLQVYSSATRQYLAKSLDSIRNSRSLMFSYNIKGISGIQKFMASLPANSNQNFIIGRGILVKHECNFDPDIFQTFRDITLELLSKVGKHLWYITFDLTGYNCMDVYLALHSFMRYLPNLRKLKLCGECYDILPRQKWQLVPLLTQRPLPAIHSLQTIIIEMKGIDSRIDHAIVSLYNDAIKKIGLSLDSQNFYHFHAPLKNLVELSLFNVTNTESMEDLLLKLAKHSAPLKKFTAKMLCPVNAVDILEYLRVFEIQMVKIHADIPSDKCSAVGDEDGLKDIPTIHTLKLLLNKNMSCSGPDRLCSALLKCFMNVPPSNWFWTKFPNLNHLHVNRYRNSEVVFSRPVL